MDNVFSCLAEPHRRRILDLLREGERSAGDLGGAIGISQPSASKHLRVLRHAGLVRATIAGQRRIYALRPEGLAAVEAWLSPYLRFWADRLEALDTHFNEEH
jgi:DNA-binding transcriptional ArsR family regulator